MSTFAATIVVVLDHKVGDEDSFNSLRATLHGLAGQDYREAVEFLLVESAAKAKDLPTDLIEILPDLKIIETSGTSSFELKNAGAEAANAPLVVILDADCRPSAHWWRSVYDHWRENPDAAVISGRTFYEGNSLLGRIFAVIDRSYVDVGSSGATGTISNNNAAFAKACLLETPFNTDVGPFGSEPHSDQIRKRNRSLRFEPGMVAYHSFTGWEMIREERRHIGFSLTRYRQLHPDARNGWMVRHPHFWIPYLVAASTYADVKRSFRHASAYHVRWYQVPLIWLYSFRAHLMSVEGIKLALSGGWVGDWKTYR